MMVADSAMPELISLEVSPWSARARWALGHHSVPYKVWTYIPIVGERGFRRKVNKWDGLITAPALITPEDVTLLDSWDIAVWADAHSRKPGAAKLLPEGKLEGIRRWEEQGNLLQGYLRSHFTELASTDMAIAKTVAPPGLLGIPLIGGALASLIGPLAIRALSKKYTELDAGKTLDKAQAVLQELKEALAANGSGYILGCFTYADIVLAIPVRLLAPPGQPRIGLTPEGKLVPSYSQELYDEFHDLIGWADNIFVQHYPT